VGATELLATGQEVSRIVRIEAFLSTKPKEALRLEALSIRTLDMDVTDEFPLFLQRATDSRVCLDEDLTSALEVIGT
jgi:hypothetical protein